MIKAYYCTKNNFHCVKKASDNRQSRIIFQGINLYLILTGIFLTTIITQLLRQLDKKKNILPLLKTTKNNKNK